MHDARESQGYLHGFTRAEQDRLRRQARQLEFLIYEKLPFRRTQKILEVGCGVGAQTAILLRRFPDLHVTGLDASEENLALAREYLATVPWAEGRCQLQQGQAEKLPFEAAEFDGAFLCWILEHVGDPSRVLSEVRRCLKQGSFIVVTEVMNATFFLDPYSPNTLKYWMAFNDHQWELGGDPFVGAKLGNLLQAVGYRDILTDVKTLHLDNRCPGDRAEFLKEWTDMLLSAAPDLQATGKISEEIVEGMKKELESIGHDPNAVFYSSFVQAQAKVW
jgi:ubiquinone/menaquinone biosynthesis C-methylase UbiE